MESPLDEDAALKYRPGCRRVFVGVLTAGDAGLVPSVHRHHRWTIFC